MPYNLEAVQTKGLVIRVQYDQSDANRNMFSWHGTSFDKVLHSPLYWMLVGCHWVLFWLRQLDPTQDPLSDDPILKVGRIKYYMDAFWVLTPGDIGALSSLATFFVVFYAGNCFGRYNTMYNSVVAIQGKMHNISLYVRVYFQQPTNRWTVIRYLLASHFIFYWSLRRRYYDWKNRQYLAGGDPGSFKDLIDNSLLPLGVLIGPEAEALIKYSGNKHKLLYSWSMVALKRIMQAPQPKGEKSNPMLQSEFEQTSLVTDLKDMIVEMRGAIGAIDNGMLFPIPFMYYHIVNVTMTAQMLLFSYAFCFVNGKKGTPMTLFLYPLVVLVVFGLREVANAIADPFGTDSTDFNQDAIVMGVYNDCKKLCEEPEEPFLAKLGDPDFNPNRNEDGTLAEAVSDDPEPKDKDTGGVEEEKVITWPDSEVQLIIEEKNKLEDEVRYGQIQKLKLQVGALVDVTSDAMEKLITLDKAPPQLEVLMGQMHTRMDRLERLVTDHVMRFSGELRGDPYANRYIGEADTAMQASLVQSPQRGNATLGTGRVEYNPP